MKLSVLLGISLAANAALLAVVMQRVSGGPSEKPAAVSSAGHDSDAHGSTRAGEPTDVNAREAVKTENSWTHLAGGTLQQMVERLRAAGYPPSVIRALVAARLAEQTAARRREMMAGVEDPPYWNRGLNIYNPKVAAAQRELYQEQQKIMRELLGSDATDDNEINQYYRRRQFGDIAPEKAEEIQRISSDYGDMRAEIYAKTNGMLMSEDREQIAFLEKELRSDLAKVMTPQELENYEVRSSMTANTLRSQLTTFQPSEDEFRALFRATRALEEKFGPMQGMFSQEQMQQRQQFLNEQAKLALAPDRFAEFAQATDPKYGMINRVVARYELPSSVVPQVAAVQDELMKRSAGLRTLKGAEQMAQVAALTAEAEARIKPLLGARGYEAYKIFAGQWIDRIKQPTPAPTPKG